MLEPLRAIGAAPPVSGGTMPSARLHPATAAEISATLAEAGADELPALLERYADDPRAQVRRACGVA